MTKVKTLLEPNPDIIVKGTQAAWWSYGVNIFQTEITVEIYSKSLVRVIGEVLIMKFS